MRKSGGAGKKKQPNAIDEVEELLKLTQDDLLLKLTVNSHIKSQSKSKSKFDIAPEFSHTNAIDSDLDRRFQALRSKPSKPSPKTETTAENEDVDNLFARFAALKGPNATTTSNYGINDVEDEYEEDEVAKIINWAKDAARLDPSPSSDKDDVDDNEDDDSDDDDDSDSDSDDEAAQKINRKKKGPSKK